MHAIHLQNGFYRAMHYSAKRGLTITSRLSVRPSVRLSVCDVGASVCLSVRPNIFALRSQTIIHLLPGEHGETWGRLGVGWENVACWSTKAAISLKRAHIEEKLLGGL